MRTTFIQVKEILNTLPIGYYLGRAIDVTLDETGNASYFDPGADKIVISYPMIARAVERISLELFSVEAIEEVIRGLLYHEISHVILTPTGMRMTKVLNIVEDERIESLCKSVYMNTDFFKNLLLINNYKGEAPTNVESAFYQLVRFHVGDEYWLNRFRNLLKRYRHITHDNDRDSYDYEYAVSTFYKEFCEWFGQQEEEKKNEGNNDSSEENENGNGDESQNSSNDSEEMEDNSEVAMSGSADEDNTENSENEDGTKNSVGADNTENAEEDTDNEEEGNEETGSNVDNSADETENEANKPEDIDDMSYGGGEFKDIAQTLINKYQDNALTGRLLTIVNEAIKKNKQNGAAINSYSGRFSARAVADRDDYKWWTAQNRMGHLKQNSKVHFNLFIDNSGSFTSNEVMMNKFIKALDKVEKQIKDFTFDVITINTSIDEWENHNRLFRCGGGNRLEEIIATVIKRHTKPNHSVYNIVLFDGDAHCNDYLDTTGTSEDNFKYFGDANTIIVTDSSNKQYIEPSVKKARVIYTRNYCAEFIDRVCETLKRVM